MKLQTQLVIAATLVGVIAAVIIAGAARTLVMPSFAKIENDQFTHHQLAIRDAVNNETESLATRLTDWASWDDSYNFMESRDPKYIESNIQAATISGMKINCMQLCDLQLKPVAEIAADLTKGVAAPYPRELDSFLSSSKEIKNMLHDATVVVKGIVKLPQGSMHVAIKPILKTDGSGDIRGVFLMGRYLDDDKIKQLSAQTHFNLEIKPPNQLAGMTHLGTDKTQLCIPFFDIAGQPAYTIETTCPRPVFQQAKTTLKQLTGGVIFAVVMLSLVLIVIIRKTVVSPVIKLRDTVKHIAETGDLSYQVPVFKGTELGDLSNEFLRMNNHLQQIIGDLNIAIDRADAATRANVDILNAIDQGIITLGMDLKAGAEHSQRARKVLGFADFAERPGSQILRLDAARTEQFHSWLKIVRDPKKLKRWEKYVELCPAQELLIKDDNGEERIIGLDYRPILDKDGSLIRLMVLASDVTEARQTKLALDTFRREQQGQMDRIVGLVNSDSGTIAAFTAAMVVSLARAQVLDMLAAAAQVHELFRDFHTLKGNAGSLGFSSLAQAAGLVEDVLERLRAGELPADLEEKWKQSLTSLNLEVKSFQELKDKLFADQDGLSVDRTRYEQLLDIATHGQTLPAAELANALLDLDAAPFESLCRKYGNIVAQYREANGRQINDIHYYHGHSMIRRSLLRRIDNSLVHLVRNAVDHGLEDDENRQALGKGPGQITLSFTHSDESLMISVSDDGRGIDADAVAASAVRKGVISAEEANKLGQEEKIHLIFLPGFSTKEAVSETSGRGVGMDAVKSEVEAEGGSISIRTQIGQGTSFTINLPV